MPITQQRMLSVLDAAQDYKQALLAAQDLIQINRQRVAEGKLSPSDALEYLSQFIEPSLLLRSPVHSHATLLVEQRHFKSHAKRNDRAALRQARKRRSTENAMLHHNSKALPYPTHYPPPPQAAPSPIQQLESPPDLSSDTLPEKEELF